MAFHDGHSIPLNNSTGETDSAKWILLIPKDEQNEGVVPNLPFLNVEDKDSDDNNEEKELQ